MDRNAFKPRRLTNWLPTARSVQGTIFHSFRASFWRVWRKSIFGRLQTKGPPPRGSGYAVPIGESRFTTRTDSDSDVMGYHGKFTVDVPKGELEQLEILTDDMPESAHVCAFDMKTDYKVTLLKGIPFELPASVAIDALAES